MRILSFLVSLCLLIGCGAVPKTVDTSPKSPQESVRPLPQPGQYYTSGLVNFGARKGLKKTSVELRLIQNLRRTLRPPATIDCLAREYAARFGADGKDPAPSVTHALAQHCGYWSRPRSQYSVTGKTIEEIEVHLRSLPDQITQGTFGLGAVIHPDGRFTVTLLIPPQDLSLSPITRSGETLVEGRLQTGDGKIEVWVQDNPNGPARRLDKGADATGKFSLRLQGNVGSHRVEVARVRGGFRQTIAILHRGTDRPKSYALPKPRAFPNDDFGVTKAFNARRSIDGLSPLESEHHLAGPLNDWMNRISKNSGSDTPPGMLDLRGWRYARLDYGFTYGSTATEAIELLAATPTGHHLLSTREHGRLAVGILPFQHSSGFDAVVVALSRFKVIPPDEARQKILNAMNVARQESGLSRLSLNPGLTQAAQEAAEAVMSGRLAWKNAIGALGQTVAKRRLAAGAFGSGGSSVVNLAELAFQTEPAVMTPQMSTVGVGVIGGPLPGGGSPRYIIIFVAAEKIPGKS